MLAWLTCLALAAFAAGLSVFNAYRCEGLDRRMQAAEAAAGERQNELDALSTRLDGPGPAEATPADPGSKPEPAVP